MRSIPLLLCAALATGTAGAAEVYRWTDAQGVTHYSDTPPPRGTAHELIDAPEPPPPVVDAAGGDAAIAADGATPVSAEQMANATENCERARGNVRTLEESPIVRMDLDGDGEMDELDATQRAAQLEAAQRQVEAFCEP